MVYLVKYYTIIYSDNDLEFNSVKQKSKNADYKMKSNA